MRVVNLQELDTIREDAVSFWLPWKQRSLTLDSILSDDWQTVWDDLTVEESAPLVENTILEAMEDKAAEAAGVAPSLMVPPRRGTRSDKAERNAEMRRRVAKSYWDRSALRERLLHQFYLDWWGHGVAVSIGWHTFEPNPEDRVAYFMRVNPRQFYPLAHDSTGRLTAAVLTRMRNVKDLELEYGTDHPAMRELYHFRISRNFRNPMTQVEETWYIDDHQIAVMITDRDAPPQAVPYRTVSPYQLSVRDAMSAWLVEPKEHGLRWNPMIEAKRDTFDDDYRSPLDSAVPRLRVAQNIMARHLEDIADSVFTPVLMENIINPEDFGPNAEMIGDGTGNAKIEYPRKPVNFEARQTVFDQVEMSRRQLKHPANRAGEASASIVSATGERQLLGAFNAELALAQTDIAHMLKAVTQITAHIDEIWAPGRKTIEGFEHGKSFQESYDPTTLWKGDYRMQVSYGPASGLDAQNLLVRLSTGRNLGALAKRSFMVQSGLVEDPLQEEREIALEQITDALFATMIQQAQEGNPSVMQILAEKIDDDTMSLRQAVLETIKESQTVSADAAAAGAGPPGGDAFTQQRSLEAGGIPGNAEALRGAGRSLVRGLPPNVRGGLRAVGADRG